MTDSISIEQVEKALDFIRDNAKEIAHAKANRIYLEEFRKSKKALLFQQAPEGNIAERESFAYSHKDYMEVLDGIKQAVHEEERLRWLMIAAQAKIEVWRSLESSRRSEGKIG